MGKNKLMVNGWELMLGGWGQPEIVKKAKMAG
jgi:hypothetical protein